jgi:hypothetical protein
LGRCRVRRCDTPANGDHRPTTSASLWPLERCPPSTRLRHAPDERTAHERHRIAASSTKAAYRTRTGDPFLRGKWSSEPLRKRENRAVARFLKPSAGLEPATPSLPSTRWVRPHVAGRANALQPARFGDCRPDPLLPGVVVQRFLGASMRGLEPQPQQGRRRRGCRRRLGARSIGDALTA